MKRLLPLLCALFLTAASAPKYRGVWTSLQETGAVGTIIFEKGKYKKIGRVVPARLYELTDDTAVAGFSIDHLKQGTLMVPVDGSLRKLCRLERHGGSAFACLSDTDGDGLLDTYFGTQVFKEFFTGSVGDDGGFEPLVRKVSFKEVDPALKAPEINLEFEYVGRGKNSTLLFRFCLSKKIMDGRKYYQSSSRKGYSVICTFDTRAATESPVKIQAFGVGLEVVRFDKTAMEIKFIPVSERTFTTVSGFR